MHIVIGGRDETPFRLAEALMVDHEVTLICPEHGAGDAPGAAGRGRRLRHGDLHGTAPPRAVSQERTSSSRPRPIDENNLVACVSARHLGAKRTICFLDEARLPAPKEDRVNLAESLGIDKVVVPARAAGRGDPADRRHPRRPRRRGVRRRQRPPPAARHRGGRGHHAGDPDGHRPARGRGPRHGAARRAHVHPQGVARTCSPATRSPPWGRRPASTGCCSATSAARCTARTRRAPRSSVGGAWGWPSRAAWRALGWTVRIIEADRDRCEEIAPLLDGLVLHGDGTDLDLLESERIGDDPVLVAVTSNDEKNLLVSLLAKHLGVQRILTRADLQPNERLFEKVGIDVVLSARGAAIRSVLRRRGSRQGRPAGRARARGRRA